MVIIFRQGGVRARQENLGQNVSLVKSLFVILVAKQQPLRLVGWTDGDGIVMKRSYNNQRQLS